MKTYIFGLILMGFSLSGSASATMSDIPDYIQSLVDLSMLVEEDFQVLERELFAQAPPDECFYGVGDARNEYHPAGISCDDCPSGSQPKVNQAYVWGLAKTGDDIWFGTGPNVHCLVIGGYLMADIPTSNESYACEFGDSPYADLLGDALGDFRPARIYKYNITNKELEDITPSAMTAPLLAQSLGIRSAGAHDGVVFFAGPGLSAVNMFAFDSETGAFLGQQSFPEYANIRKWLVHEDVLYTAVGNAGAGGSVLKWTGSKSDPFQFEVVGELDGQGAELESHDGRIFVTTWPGSIGNIGGVGATFASLFMSPAIGAGGLSSADKADWQKVWTTTDYEPDPVVALTYGGGALASFDGQLYWGTMHVPFLSTVAHFTAYGVPSTPDSLVRAILGTFRSISIFRGDNFDTTPEIELLYGSPLYPAYDPMSAEWSIVPNNSNLNPTYGPPGFGNPFNNYTWTMDTYEDKLYVGTMDFSYLLFGNLDIEVPMTFPFDCSMLGMDTDQCEMFEKAYNSISSLFDPANYLGADLMRFDNGSSPAIPESIRGVGNNASYGIRTMIGDEDGLFLGMANPMNLLACEDSELKALNNGPGGWSLMGLGVANQNNEPIPTLSEWGLMILLLSLMITSIVLIRSRSRRFV